jgi:hypothetical protein
VVGVGAPHADPTGQYIGIEITSPTKNWSQRKEGGREGGRDREKEIGI